MALDPGTRLGPYEIVDALGAGGMGEVYRARDTRLHRTVAIKVLPGHLSDQPQARQRFEREARAVSDLNHPHICTLHDIGQDGGVDYLVMEYLEGRTLADRLAEGPLAPDQALEHGAQIADALAAAHGKGVVHRDLKPGNVMLTQAGAKLLDFGLARTALAGAGGGTDLTASPTMTSPLTAEGVIVGTFQYMAPEQLEGKEADARSDIFAFGALLYEMLTAKRAFEGESQASLIASILKEDPRPVSSLTPMAPRALDRLVRRCMAKQPAERWQSARDLALELKWIAEAGDEAVADERGVRPVKRAAWVPWAVSGVALLLAAFFAVRGISTAPGSTSPVRLMISVPGATEFDVDELAAPPALSPDGRTVVFGVMDDNGGKSLWLRSIDDFSARPLANTDGAQYVFWSPDSRNVGFFAAGKIKRAEVATGRVQTVTDAAYARGGTWSTGGKILFAPNSNTGIHVVDAAGGAVSQLTEPDPNVPDSSHRWPCFLPDGRNYLFVSWTNDPDARVEHGGVFLASLDGEEPPSQVLPDASSVAYAPPGHLLVVRGENLIAVPFDARKLRVAGEAVVVAESVHYNPSTGHAAFSASTQGTLVYAGGTAILQAELVWHDRGGAAIATVGEPAPYFDIRLAPDETRAAAAIFGESSSTGEIWTVDLTRGVRTRLAFGAWYHENPVWSPEGDRIMYVSQETGSLDFFTRPADGSGRHSPFYLNGKDKTLFDWSPDGKYVAFWEAGDRSATADIWIYSAEEQKAEPLLAGEPAYSYARFSPDTRWIAYVSDESAREEVFIQAFGGLGEGGVSRGGRWQVSTNGGRMPHWRGDGRELVYVDPGRRVMAVQVEPRPGGLVLGTPEELFRISGTLVAYDAADDHQRFLITARDETVSEPIHVVLNWTADLGG